MCTDYSSVVGLFGAEFFLHLVSLFLLLFCCRYLPLTVAICCRLTDLKDPVSQKSASLLWQHVPILWLCCSNIYSCCQPSQFEFGLNYITI